MDRQAANPKIAAILLAAGGSRRMGRPKQLLEIAGRPLVVRAAEIALEAGAWPVVVVLGASAPQIRPLLARLPVLTVENAAWTEGMASSLRSGVAALRQFERGLAGAFVVLCDQPGLSAGVLRQLAEAWRSSGLNAAAARYSGRLGAPALFGREHFAALAALTGEDGARAALNADPARVAAVDLPEMETDLDTPADYDRWRGIKAGP